MQITNREEFHTHNKTSKVKQYSWGLKDAPGKLVWIHKSALCVDHTYQREASLKRVLSLAKDWSWLACGVLTVAQRPNQSLLYVVDGQHRLLAAMKRSDIQEMPCLVFDTQNIKDEAVGFFDANTNRRLPTWVEKWKAQLLSEDPITMQINDLIVGHGRTVGECSKATDIRCLSALTRAAKLNMNGLIRLWPLLIEICAGKPFHEHLVEGFIWLETNIANNESLLDKKWEQRIIKIGYQELLAATQRASSFYARGGAKVWGLGMMEALNKGLRNQMQVKAE